jgi:hypothetical protein
VNRAHQAASELVEGGLWLSLIGSTQGPPQTGRAFGENSVAQPPNYAI